MKKKIVYILTFPIQYHSPLLRKMAVNDKIDLVVYYLSEYGVRGSKRFHPDLGMVDKWDIPLLDGYKYKFIKNYNIFYRSTLPKGFFGFINPGIFFELLRDKPDLVIINGWNNFSYLLAALIAKILGYKTAIRGDNPVIHETKKSRIKIIIKKFIIGKLFTKLFDHFLYVGKYNKEYYKYYGVSEEKLVFTPHAVDNDRFRNIYNQIYFYKDEIKKELGLTVDSVIILFCGLLIDKKRPMDLLLSYEKIKKMCLGKNISLVYVGDGFLKGKMQNYIKEKQIEDVVFAGFVNQSEITKYYSVADIFVLPSTIGETWGLVVNEAMNFGLPIIVSDMVGCSGDLVDGNGFIFKTGDLDDLIKKLIVLIENKELREKMSRQSMEIIKNYSYEQIINGLLSI